MAITLSGTVWIGKYKITILEDIDYSVVFILRSEIHVYMFIDSTDLCIYHIGINTSDSYVVLIRQPFLSLSLSLFSTRM